MAQSGTTYAVVYGVIARNVAADRRSWAMGIAAAAGSFGQFLMVPVENWLIGHTGWQNALFALGCGALAILPLAFGLREAFAYPSFRLLMAGYFVCGFQLAFIGVHMPSYLKDRGLTPDVATTALALIGLFNVLGTYGTGWLGARLAKRHMLSAIYLLRALAIAVFVLAPLSAASSYGVVGWIAVALGVFAALVNLPVREHAIVRGAPQPA